jgi:hypothetical protein
MIKRALQSQQEAKKKKQKQTKQKFTRCNLLDGAEVSSSDERFRFKFEGEAGADDLVCTRVGLLHFPVIVHKIRNKLKVR